MADTKVDPPPLNQPVVDPRGYPAPRLVDFLYRLWKRTGGEQDLIGSGSGSSTTIQMAFPSGARASAEEQLASQLALMQAQLGMQASRIQALENELSALRGMIHQAAGQGMAHQAGENADSANAMALVAAHRTQYWAPSVLS